MILTDVRLLPRPLSTTVREGGDMDEPDIASTMNLDDQAGHDDPPQNPPNPGINRDELVPARASAAAELQVLSHRVRR